MGIQLIFPKRGTAPLLRFLAHVCCDQTARWINMPLTTEADLGPGDIVLDGDSALSQNNDGTELPNFGPCIVVKRLRIDQDATCDGGRPRPRPHCVRWGPSSPRKGHSSPRRFGPCILSRVAKRSPISATFESRLDKFWQHQDVIDDFEAEIHGTGSRSCY